MATASASRGAQTFNCMHFKPILRKAYHRKSGPPDMMSDKVKLNGEETKNKSIATQHDPTWWIPDDRTGIYYPKGHEKVIQDVPQTSIEDFGAINWFSNHEDCI
ncbi:PREDICTED: uncharacterized protein LOC101265141 [Olea europaea subsp. europaea]|uniref:PREDICTED: uncharacterized protein LOC101265141 n=1 Tax=Olea europaea subsp. europaea TaxID=158383 RepID=A0A8S0QRU0_OLEEU|nr:PREDICTED: uncharacterized protein LOC101265141 [Olea europaea subsp. europaea]